MPLVSIRQYAASRGVSHTAVNKAVKAGKIPMVNGRIDPQVADAAWERNRDIRQVSKLAGERPAQQQPEVQSQQGRPTGPPRGSMAYVLLVRATTKAKQAQFETQKLEGRFADLAEVRQMASSLVAAAKTRLRSIGNKIAPQIAIESDAASCQAMIDAEVDEALAELAQWEPQAA